MTPNASITQPNANHRALIMMVSRISQMPPTQPDSPACWAAYGRGSGIWALSILMNFGLGDPPAARARTTIAQAWSYCPRQ
ncbi:hypothetical protein D3C73_1321930 [compost metagenome]